MKGAQAFADQVRAMSRALAASADPLLGPSPFWQDLSAEHVDKLERYGIAQFKRTVNFEYGQWDVFSIRHTQVGHVLKQLAASRVAPRAACCARMGEDGGAPMLEGRPWARFVYRLYVGLLWDLSASRDRMGCLDTCEESTLGRPIDIRYRGRIISQDLAQSALELNSIGARVQKDDLGHVAEIGAGYGRFAHMFMTMFPAARYWIFDIPPALALSEGYLSELLGPGRVIPFDPDEKAALPPAALPYAGAIKFALPHCLRLVPDNHFDLVVSMFCLDELSPAQIEAYLDLIDRKCRGWVYLKGENLKRHEPSSPWGLPEFPYPRRWRLVHHDVDPVHPAYVERIFDLRG